MVAGDTSTFPNPPAVPTHRNLLVTFKVPIAFDCNMVDRRDCNGTFLGRVRAHPAQNDGDAPLSPALVVTGVIVPCGGRAHAGNVTVQYSASYAGTEAVDGTLIVDIETPAAKGMIRHRLSVEVTTPAMGSPSPT